MGVEREKRVEWIGDGRDSPCIGGCGGTETSTIGGTDLRGTTVAENGSGVRGLFVVE